MYKLDGIYKVREICGESIVVKQGTADIDMTRVISLNATAVALFTAFAGRTFEANEVVGWLQSTYGIDESLATRDASSWIDSLLGCGVIKEV